MEEVFKVAHMESKDYEKYKRLTDRLCELSDLNAKIGRLAFYIETTCEKGAVISKDMKEQYQAMISYRDSLQSRIQKGDY